jgi:MFS family permease
MRKLFAIRDARLLLAGETLSMFGNWALLFALAIWVKDLTGSNAAAGMVFFTLALPAVAAPFAGFVVDRFRRRRVMIAVDVAAGLAVLGLLFVHDRSDLWLLYAVAALYGATSVVFNSGLSALLTVILPDDVLPDGNAAFQTIRQGLRLFAPLAGAGLFVAVGGGTVAVIDAATFAVSALCLAGLRVEEPPPTPPEQRFLRELVAGVVHVVRTIALRQIVFGTAVAVLVIGFAETVIFAVVDEGLGRPPSFLGVLASMQGLGSIAGGLTAARLLRAIGDTRLVGAGLGIFALGDALLVLPHVAAAVAGFTVAGVGVSWAVVAFGTAIQRRSPAHLQGRVFSAADTMLTIPQTASIGIGAALVTVLDYRILIVAMATVTIACALYLLTRRREPESGADPGTREAPASRGVPAPVAVE